VTGYEFSFSNTSCLLRLSGGDELGRRRIQNLYFTDKSLLRLWPIIDCHDHALFSNNETTTVKHDLQYKSYHCFMSIFEELTSQDGQECLES